MSHSEDKFLKRESTIAFLRSEANELGPDDSRAYVYQSAADYLKAEERDDLMKIALMDNK